MKTYSTTIRLVYNIACKFLEENKITFKTWFEDAGYTIYHIDVLDRTEEFDEWIAKHNTL